MTILFSTPEDQREEMMPLTIATSRRVARLGHLRSHDDDSNLGNRSGRLDLGQHQSTWQKPIAINILPRHCTRPWPKTPGGFEHSTNQASLAARRVTVKADAPECYRERGVPTLAGWESNSHSCPTQFEAVQDPTPPQANPPPPLSSSASGVRIVDPVLKNQLQHFSSRRTKQIIRNGLELVEHLTQRDCAPPCRLWCVLEGSTQPNSAASQFINGLVTRSGFDGAEHGLNRFEHLPDFFGILHAFVVKMHPKMFPSALVHLVNHFAFEVAHVEKTGTLRSTPPRPTLGALSA